MSDSESPLVTTRLGAVRGAWTNGVARFLGIPYAQPPTGALRYAAPEPVAAWSDTLHALDYGPTPQRVADARALIPEPTVRGAATLNLNIWTPDPGPSSKLPVMVYIHGGGYTTGSAASPWYDGAAFARDGVVFVSLSYRLGFDGFGWIDGAPHNRGVLDWLCALRWVHDHIGAFGGDEGRITIAGQSAGGGAVLTLLGMPQTAGLVSAGWAASPAVTDVSAESARSLSLRMAKLLGVSPDRDGFSRLGERSVLRAQPRARHERTADPFAAVTRGLALGPTIDGELLQDSTFAALTAASPIPLVVGATHDEFMLSAPSALARAAKLLPRRAVLAAARVPHRARRPYLRANADAARGGPVAVAARFASDLVFGGAVVAAAQHAHPAWAYRFDWASPVQGGAVHCADVPFFFDNLHAERVGRVLGKRTPQPLADDMHRAAVRFATVHDPGWVSWSTAPGTTKLFGGERDLDPHGWSRVTPLTRAGVTPRTPPGAERR